MNTIPLVKGNTQEEINTSLIALKKALDEMNSSSSKTDASVQSQIKQINELITDINSQITNLQPVDSVTSGNMQSVSSNAVYNALFNKNSINPSTDVNLPDNNEEFNFYNLPISEISVNGVKSALVSNGFQNIRSGTSIIEFLGNDGQRVLVILSHSGNNYFAGMILTWYFNLTYIRYSDGTWD